MLGKITMKRVLLILIILVFFNSCKAKYHMPNDTYKYNGYVKKWYSQEKRGIIKSIHHPRWANNKR